VTRLWIGVLRLLHALLPIRALAWLGEAFGSLLYRLARTRRHVVQTNLRLCFPELPEAERSRLARAHVRAFGRSMLLETVSWWGSAAEVERLVEVQGADLLEQYAGKPVVLLVPHFVGINSGGIRMTRLPVRLVNIYSPVKNPAIERVVADSRHRFGEALLFDRHAGIKPVLRALKQGYVFHYSPDQDYGRKDAIFAPFFGVPAATITGLSRVARAAGAVVIPALTVWEQGRYILRFHPAWEGFPSADAEADTRRMNAWLEAQIRQYPEQYFWVHRRFKTRPPGEKGFYDA
jgi:KDO2-lipid IV(A) lauroyltransferase